jgi:hypothetical protein
MWEVGRVRGCSAGRLSWAYVRPASLTWWQHSCHIKQWPEVMALEMVQPTLLRSAVLQICCLKEEFDGVGDKASGGGCGQLIWGQLREPSWGGCLCVELNDVGHCLSFLGVAAAFYQDVLHEPGVHEKGSVTLFF